MPLPGGATDKFGNRYEGIWTVRCMIDVLLQRTESIRLEPPGMEGEGVEFWLKSGNSVQYHQVKRQNASNGNWTISELGNKGVLKHFWDRLQNSTSSCIFISTNSTSQLEELSDRSKRSASLSEFSQIFIKAQSLKKAFEELRSRWNNCTELEAYNTLKRIDVEIIGERSLRSTVERELGSLIDGNPANAVDVLAQLALSKIHQELNADDIWMHLSSRGFSQRKTYTTNTKIDYFSCPSPLYFTGRVETLEELRRAVHSNSIIVVGGLAGIGKTYLVSKYVEGLDIEKAVLWLDCGIYGQLNNALIRLADFFNHKFSDESLLELLQTPLIREQRLIEVAAKLCDNYQCTLVWDGYDPEIHTTLLLLFQECNRVFRTGKILITTRTSLEFTTAINPVYKLVVPQITQEAGIELMRFYLTHLGLEMYSDDVLAKAYNRVDGHPYFLRSLVILSETYSLPAILESLPKFQQQIQNYIKEQVFSQLTESSRELITRLSVLRAPFTLDAIHSFDAISEVDRSFEMLLNKYLITKQSKWSLFFEIHDLVREYGLLQLSAEQLKGSHSLAAKYYQSLESKTYGDAIELIHHLLEADMQDSAAREAEHLISNALHSGLFNLVTSYTSHLLTDERAKSWSVIHFTRGRAFRLQGKVPEALKSYEAALACARDEHLMDASKSEIAGMLIRQGERSNKNYDIDRAKILYEELSQSRNIETQVAGLTSLGYLNVRGKKWNKGVGLLHRALKLAEEAHLQRSIMQIKIGLGIAYAKKDNLLATEYLEQASKIRREIRPQYGEQDIESEYYLFDALAGVYRSQKRFEDSVKASNECVSIDRQLNLEERLAHSLFQLGKDNCLLHRYASARDALQESLLIIKKLNLRGEPENAVLEWLVTALWNSRQYENAVEKLSEFIYLNQNVKGSPNKHVVVREIDLIDVSVPDFIMLHGNTFHLLVLPKLYDYDNLKEWNQRVVSRRPELAEVKLFYR